jgi:hypothetical protein
MAIGAIQGSLYYDPNRDMYYSEREMHYRRQEDEYRRAQQQMGYNPAQQQAMIGHGQANTTSKPDPKDPLSFLSKADNKLLLTGEAP